MIDQRLHLVVALDRIDQQDEFVAADPRQHVGLADAPADALGDLDQQRVADGMAVVVVDVLEVVEVDERQREAAVFSLALEHVFHVLLDQRALRQSGQFVEIGASRQLVFGLLALGDVERSRAAGSRRKCAPTCAR